MHADMRRCPSALAVISDGERSCAVTLFEFEPQRSNNRDPRWVGPGGKHVTVAVVTAVRDGQGVYPHQ
jgi:hypothetical protein